jgi:ATP-dependent DNA helicase RecQ
MAVGSALSILERAGHVERGGNDQYASVEFVAAIDEDATTLDAGRGAASLQRVIAALARPSAPRPGAVRQVNISALAAGAGLSSAQVRRALEQLDARGVVRYRAAFLERGITLLDERPAAALRVDRNELARRAAAEQRKLRRVVDYAYHRGCLRAYILAYFGDRRAAFACGTCSGCEGSAPPRRGSRAPERDVAEAGTLRVRGSSRPTDLDAFILDSAPTGDALRERLRETSRERERQRDREVLTDPDAPRPAAPPVLDEARTTVVRKILACVARAKERFGKSTIAGVLRGSKAKNILEARLDQLSTYGLLAEMRQDELVAWCDALVDAGLLGVTPGSYPTLYLTPQGTAVMKGTEPARVDLRRASLEAREGAATEARANGRTAPSEPTVDVTLALFESGLSVDEIAERRSLTPITVEGHIAELVESGRIGDVARLVTGEQYRAIEEAARVHGIERLKPLREALGHGFGYREIRFVVADLRRKRGA